MWYIHIMEFYSPFKKKKIQHQVTLWMYLEDSILSEINEIQKDKNFLISFT